MPFYRDYYKENIILGKALHSLLVWLGKEVPKPFHLSQLFSQRKRELAIHGWISRQNECVSADFRVESFSDVLNTNLQSMKEGLCYYKHVVVISATHMTWVIWMMNTHLALWNRALIFKWIWQMAAPQTLVLWKCVINWRLCLLLASQKKSKSNCIRTNCWN